ncbi:MAG: DUF2089 domain-containing protein [Chloroflexi bacterium]|nr:DUF2089 domain-containing protein [Chloroflexota bacterium]
MTHPVVGRCPVCDDVMDVTRLHCRSCDTSIEGRFSLGRFSRLNPEQIAFAETFLRCEGKITRVEEELGISYPTVRNRLSEVVRALGYEVQEEEATASAEQRRDILSQLSAGTISSDDAVRLLKAR